MASSACLIDSSQLPSQGYMEVLWHSRIAPACLSDSPLFICISLTGCHHPYAGKCTRCPRLFLPWYHWPSQSLDSLGTFTFIHFNRLHVVVSYDAAMFAYAAAPGVAQLLCRPEPSLKRKSPTSFLHPSFLRIRHLLLSRISLPRQIGNSWGRTLTCKICSFKGCTKT
jgi:hypothetical protein